jgi:hypothetical protein
VAVANCEAADRLSTRLRRAQPRLGRSPKCPSSVNSGGGLSARPTTDIKIGPTTDNTEIKPITFCFYELSPSRGGRTRSFAAKDGGCRAGSWRSTSRNPRRPRRRRSPRHNRHRHSPGVKAAATAAPKRPKSAEDIVQLVLDKAAAEEGASQGGSAGDGSQKAAEAEGEEGAIADGTHLATGNMDVGTVRRKASKQDKKENVLITEMARRVRNWGIAKPQNAQHCVWTWGFKYKNPPKCEVGFQNRALCAMCLVDHLGAATVKLGKDNSPLALVTHLQYSHPAEYEQMWAMEQKRKAKAHPSRSSPRKRPTSLVPGAQGHVDAVRLSMNTLFSGVVSHHAPESVRAPMSANPAGLRSHWAPVESQAEVNRRPDPRWVDSLVSLIAEEFLPLELVDKASFRE